MANGAVRLSEKDRKWRLKKVRTFSGNTESSSSSASGIESDRRGKRGENRPGVREKGCCYMKADQRGES